MLQSTLALRTPRYYPITDKIQIPGERYRGLTENDSRYYGITDTFVKPKEQFIVLTLDKADIMNFSYEIVTKNCSLMLTFLSKHTLKDFWNIFIFASIISVAVQHILPFHFSLRLFPSDTRRDEPLSKLSSLIPNEYSTLSPLLISLS